MAIGKYGVNSKLLTLDPSQRSMAAGGVWGGSAKWMMDKYVIEAGDANGLVIKLGRILKGQKVGEMIVETPEGLGAGCTIKVGAQFKDGSADNDARFISATAFANANTKLSINAPGTGRQFEATADMDIIATIGGANPTVAASILLTALLATF